MCNICHLPCRDSLISACCGQGFCKGCFDRCKSATTISQACPICCIDPFIANPQPEADHKIKKELKVWCPNKKDGCNWIGVLLTINHFKSVRDVINVKSLYITVILCIFLLIVHVTAHIVVSQKPGR